MTDVQVLISGAGPTGLFAALWLAHAGVRVRIVDPKPGPTQESRAIVVHARTLELYDQLGIGADALAHGRHFDSATMWMNGRSLGSVYLRAVATSVTPHNYAYILTQDENEALLIAHLQRLGVSIDWNTALVGFTQDDHGVIATIERGGASETVRAAYVLGCDGAHSVVRHTLGIPFGGGTYDLLAYVADIEAKGPIRPDDINLALFEDDKFLAFFPMPGKDRYRVVGSVPPEAGEHPTFETLRPDIERGGLARVQAVRWYSSYRVHHRVATRFRDQRAFLLGDAGHIHSPIGGQGMNTGLGDAANLAWKLAQTLHGGNPAVLDSYDAERRPFAELLVHTTDRAFHGLSRRTALARFIRHRLLPAVFPTISRLQWAARALFRTVSQTRIEYPDSPLSTGRAGRVRGGDRLPWVDDGGTSNFAPLTSCRWQAHFYGDPDPNLATWCASRNLPVHAFPFTRTARRAGFADGALYLVRPDGYVGLAASHFDRGRLDAYAAHALPSG